MIGVAWLPSVPLPFARFLRTGAFAPAPTPRKAVILYIGFTLAGFATSVLYSVAPRLKLWLRRRHVPGQALAIRLKPSVQYCRLVAHRDRHYWRGCIETDRLDRMTGHWDLIGLFVLDSCAEELQYRGLPLGLALLTGVSPVGPVVAGSVLWAALHGFGKLPRHLPSAALYAWLWLTGAWLLAVGLHVGVNLLAHGLLRLQGWSETRRPPPLADD